MLPTSVDSGLPLLIVVEGENDIHFLKEISAMLHRDNSELPDLAHLTAARLAVFLPTGGSNLNEWVPRIASLNKRAFYLFDREREPETTARLQIVEMVNQMPGLFAIMTRKRAMENYLHPLAILEACGIDLNFDDDTDVAGMLALSMMVRGGESCWRELPCKRQKRLHDRAKKGLNVKAVQFMTPALLAHRDPEGEVIGWLQMIGRMRSPGNPTSDRELMPVQLSDRELATVLAALRFWQQFLTDNGVPISEHFADNTPLTVDEIDHLCERLNCNSAAA